MGAVATLAEDSATGAGTGAVDGKAAEGMGAVATLAEDSATGAGTGAVDGKAAEGVGAVAGLAEGSATGVGTGAVDGKAAEGVGTGAAVTAADWGCAAAEVGSAPCKGKLHTPIMAMRVLGFIIGISCCLLLSAARAISLARYTQPRK
ncbi:hypothetical protein C0708_20755 [Aeromonas caviae]|uniref:Uncharacterized protein n=1 Tax=Aeromonas caviae TaxID=648 RepID=A0A3S7PBU0_AERCA|nr:MULTISPECIES: hypothetical protein [Aeromonas]AXB04514.1 hypothetical protein C1C91_05405 [Aeromonas caviae]AXB10592.1 hypothetical protein C0708_20755 [Aeromonas caviae]MBL0437227.1 hypothetical protein [Aeromonas caviae]MDH0357478.1 hypothetical protein [Aeromonas caviae]MDX7820045.1 hypothetical protein [Aeromonas caviae]